MNFSSVFDVQHENSCCAPRRSLFREAAVPVNEASFQASYINDQGRGAQSAGQKRRRIGFTKYTSKEEKSGEVPHTLLVEELNTLSLQERQQVEEEVHGVADEIKEDEQFVEEKLEELNLQINKIRKKPAYDLAFFLYPAYVTDRAFLLMVLRSLSFDVALTAKKVVKHFEVKLEYFGMDKLVRDIAYKDLDEDDRANVRGSHWWLRSKDRAGRCIFFVVQKAAPKYKHPKHFVRALWWILMSGLRDEEAQKKGVVIVNYFLDLDARTQAWDTELFRHSRKLTDAMPMRGSAHHFCFDNPKLRPVMGWIQMLILTHGRVRFRTHFGYDVEVFYKLMTFGITSDIMPIDMQGTLNVERFHQEVEETRRCEEEGERVRHAENSAKKQLEYPTTLDVLLGRGRPYQKFPGNLQLSNMIDARQAAYQVATQQLEKTAISNDIIVAIKETGARLLKRSDCGQYWVEVSDLVARDKVSHGFRNNAKRDSKKMDDSQHAFPVWARESLEVGMKRARIWTPEHTADNGRLGNATSITATCLIVGETRQEGSETTRI